MKINGKETILMATLDITSIYGIRGIAMNMIAEKIGIKKPSLYNHFSSKDELINELYLFLRNKTRDASNVNDIDYVKIFEEKDPLKILQTSVYSYISMVEQKDMKNFYKVIYSERSISSTAAAILVEETNKMIQATNMLFVGMSKHNLLSFSNIKIEALSFAFTTHELIDLREDNLIANLSFDNSLLDEYLQCFCKTHEVKSND